MTAVQQFQAGMTADISGSAGNNNMHCFLPKKGRYDENIIDL
jgi:hypothetical protein